MQSRDVTISVRQLIVRTKFSHFWVRKIGLNQTILGYEKWGSQRSRFAVSFLKELRRGVLFSFAFLFARVPNKVDHTCSLFSFSAVGPVPL